MDANDYGKEFYKRAIEQEGVDYAFYGDWQRAYAKMIIDITKILKSATDERDSLLLDVGCACGVTMLGFKETGVFGNVKGIDISPFLIEKGKEKYNFTDDEIMVIDIANEKLPFDDNSITLLHCSNVLEHIEEKHIKSILLEFHRVLKPDVGYALLIVPVIKPGNSKETVEHEKSHVTIKSMQWWRSQVGKVFTVDYDIRKRFKSSLFSPNASDKNFYYYYNKGWTLYGLRKEP